MNKSMLVSTVFIFAALNLASCAKSKAKKKVTPTSGVRGMGFKSDPTLKAGADLNMSAAIGKQSYQKSCANPVRVGAQNGEELLKDGFKSLKGKYLLESMRAFEQYTPLNKVGMDVALTGIFTGSAKLNGTAMQVSDGNASVSCHSSHQETNADGRGKTTLEIEMTMPNEVDADRQLITSEAKLRLAAKSGSVGSRTEITVSSEKIDKDLFTSAQKGTQTSVTRDKAGRIIFRLQTDKASDQGDSQVLRSAEVVYRKL